MGLDMYAIYTPADNVDEKGNIINKDNLTHFDYWRKHHDLHGWMENLFRSRHPDYKDSFNCVPVRLMKEDLDNLEKDVISGSLPPTTGFFFGNFPPDGESKRKDLEFIQKARTLIAEGNAVFYDSWW